MSTAEAEAPAEVETAVSRSEQLLSAARSFLLEHSAWQKAANRPNYDEQLEKACDDLVEFFHDGDIPADCRDLATAVIEFANQIYIYEERVDTVDRNPHEGFWRAIENIRKEILNFEVPAPLKPLESIRDLALPPPVGQGVGHDQVAKIYGFIDRRGNPMPWLVQRELDSPGSVINTKGSIDGRDWEDPRETERKKKKAKMLGKTISQVTAAENVDAPPPGRNKTPANSKLSSKCPEKPRDLWEQNVGIQQAARMLQVPVEKVTAQWEKWDKEREAKKAETEAKIAAEKKESLSPGRPEGIAADGSVKARRERIEAAAKKDDGEAGNDDL